MSVASIPPREPALSLAELDLVIEAGMDAVWLPHGDAGGRSPGYTEFDPFWARLAEAGPPSEQLLGQFAFTPFVFEDVGKLIEQSSPDLHLFSSDYPHAEGGRNPIARFEKSVSIFDEDT